VNRDGRRLPPLSDFVAAISTGEREACEDRLVTGSAASATRRRGRAQAGCSSSVWIAAAFVEYRRLF